MRGSTRACAEVADIFGLGPRLDTVAAALSQGEKKLLDVASAFALDPQVILLDEPTSGVSTSDKHGIMKTLIAAAKRAGVKAIVLVEHDMDLVAAYSHRIIALSEGQVLADLPPDRFFADPHLIETVIGRAKGALMLSVRDLAVDIQGSRVLRGRVVLGGAGRACVLRWPQRGGQDDDAASHDGFPQTGLRRHRV